MVHAGLHRQCLPLPPLQLQISLNVLRGCPILNPGVRSLSNAKLVSWIGRGSWTACTLDALPSFCRRSVWTVRTVLLPQTARRSAKWNTGRRGTSRCALARSLCEDSSDTIPGAAWAGLTHQNVCIWRRRGGIRGPWEKQLG